MKSKSAVQQKKFYKLLQESKIENDPEKVIFNFSKYVLSDTEKKLLAKGLNFCLPPKQLKYADYMVHFELFYRDILIGVLNCCKLEIVFKCQARLSNSFRYKDPIPKDLISGVVYKFQCGLCNESYYGESIRHLDIRSGEHIGVSPLTGKKVKPSNNSAICDHLLHCNFLPSFDNFSVLAHENKKYLLEIKESLLIMRDKPSLNRNFNSAPLYLFDKVS